MESRKRKKIRRNKKDKEVIFIATEMSQKVEFKKLGKWLVSSELFIDLIFNDKCNYHCPFCIANTECFATEDFEKWKVSLQKTFELFDIRNIIILGGEATLDPLFFQKLDILKEVIKDKNVDNVILTTNGSMLKYEKFLDKLVKSCVTAVNLSHMNYEQKKNNLLMGGITLTKEEISHIYQKLKANHMGMRLNVNVYKGNCDTVLEMEEYVKNLSGCADAIKFSPLMVTEMFHTKKEVLDYTTEKCLTKEEIRQLYDSFASNKEILFENEKVFGYVPYKELRYCNQRVILKYMQVEDTYDLDRVIPTLKLYHNGNLSNEWDYKKNILDTIN